MDLLGILVFVVFIFLSLAGKAAQEKERRRRELEGKPTAPRAPQWPGPVAGPGFPGYPQPTFPQRPLPPRPEPAAPAPAAAPQASDAGVAREGAGSAGPQLGQVTEAEVARFEQQAQDVDREVENVRREATRVATSDPGTRQLGDLARVTDVDWAERTDNVVTVQIEGALLSSDNLAQAVVLAEIMGRPKALQGRRRGMGVR